MNGDAIFSTRPWKRAEGITTEGIPIRFTNKTNFLYAILLGKPEKDEIIIKDLGKEEISQINLLGFKDDLQWRIENNNLIIKLPEEKVDSPAISFKIELNSNITE